LFDLGGSHGTRHCPDRAAPARARGSSGSPFHRRHGAAAHRGLRQRRGALRTPMPVLPGHGPLHAVGGARIFRRAHSRKRHLPRPWPLRPL